MRAADGRPVRVVAGDLRKSGWLKDIPRDRPAMVVADGLMSFITGPEWRDMTRAVTEHFDAGVNAYSPTFSSLGLRAVGERCSRPRRRRKWRRDKGWCCHP